MVGLVGKENSSPVIILSQTTYPTPLLAMPGLPVAVGETPVSFPRKGGEGGWVSLPGCFLLLGWGLENAGPGPLSSFGWRIVRFPVAVFL